MKKKEMKQIAQRIAKAELVISNSTDEDEVRIAKDNILYYSSQISSFEDMIKIDDMVQEILSEILDK